MADTVTIRLNPQDRAVLEAEARSQGKALSTFVREVAEAKAQQVRRAAIRAEGDRVVAHLAADIEARVELHELGSPPADLP